MRLLTSAALVLFLLTACSDAKRDLTAAEVAHALRAQGLGVGIASKEDGKTLGGVFAQDSGTIEDVVVGSTACGECSGTGAHGPRIADVGLAALIYEHRADASCARSNVIGACLHKRNVVVVVRNGREQAARRALANLG